jgi:hypothetical protein
MARTAILVMNPPGKYPALPLAALSAALALTAADVANGNAAACTGREILVVQNTGAGAGTITVTSAPDALGRIGDITAYSLPAAGFAVLGPFPTVGWQQADGSLYFTASAITMLVAVVRLPSLA